jgi:hypothetical protein
VEADDARDDTRRTSLTGSDHTAERTTRNQIPQPNLSRWRARE